MNKQRAAVPFIVLAFVSLAGAAAFLAWADTLDGYPFLGVIGAVFVALLSLARIGELRRARPPVTPQPQPPKLAKAAPARTPAQARDDMEDAEIEARLAALRRQAHEPAAPVAGVRVAAELPDMEVIEAAEADAHAHAHAEADAEPVTIQEMEELRAQIERLRAASPSTQAARAERADVAMAPAAPAPAAAATGADPFARTEFSGLGESGAAPSPFEKTEFLQPVALRKP